MISNFNNLRIIKKLSDPLSRLSIVSVLILVLYVIYIVVISSYLNMLSKEQTQSKLMQFTSLASNAIASFEQDYKNKKIDKQTAIKQSAKIISNMKYVGQYGLNSILFAKIDSDNFIVVNDSTDNESRLSLNIDNPMHFNDLRNIAQSNLGSGFLHIKQINKFTQDDDELVCYVARIKHLNCFIATCLYESENNTEMIRTMKIGQIFSLIFGIILLGQYFISIRTVRKQNEDLQTIIEANDNHQALLKKTEERFNLAFDSVNDGIWEYYYNDNILYFSPKIYTMLGYYNDEFPPTIEAIESRIHPDDLANVSEAFRKVINSESDIYSVENRIKCKDQTYKWIYSRGKAVSRNEDGTLKRFIGTHTDITQLKNIEMELKDSEFKLKEILDSINDGVFIHNANTGKIQMVNKKACEMFGYTFDQMLELSVSSLSKGVSPYSDIEATALMKNSKLQGEQYYEWHSKDSSGRLFWTDITMKNTILNNENVIIVVVRDINEKKETADFIKLSEQQLRAIAESIPFEFWAADSAGICFIQNSISKKLLGDMIGKHWDSFSIDDKHKDIFSSYVTDAYAGKISSNAISRDENGVEFYYQSYFAPIKNQREVIGIMNILLDITDRIKIENMLTNRKEELERLEKIMINREIKMVELKKEIEMLKSNSKGE